MSDKPLQVMIADEDAVRSRTLASVLTASGFEVVAVGQGDARLLTLIEESNPDVVLINTGSPSRDVLEQLTTMNADHPRPVVMFSDDENRDTIHAAVRAGVSAYIVKGLATDRVEPIIETAIAQFNQHQGMREELRRTRQTLKERKVLDQAKGIIMKRRRCTEPEAFALLRQAAMNHKKRLGQVAEEIVQASRLLGPETQPVEGADQ